MSATRSQIPRYSRMLLVSAAMTILLSSCGTIGDARDVGKAYKLAIACETDEALAATDRAANSGGLSASIAELQRIVILRDAGRMSEADAAMAERNASAGADAEAVAETERAVSQNLEELQAEREKKTGSSTCP